MTIGLESAAAPPPEAPEAAHPATRARDAAQQFEALFIGQLLRSARESAGGEPGTAGACATDFAEQELARVLAGQGGLGLAVLIAKGLERASAGTNPSGNP